MSSEVRWGFFQSHFIRFLSSLSSWHRSRDPTGPPCRWYRDWSPRWIPVAPWRRTSGGSPPGCSWAWCGKCSWRVSGKWWWCSGSWQASVAAPGTLGTCSSSKYSCAPPPLSRWRRWPWARGRKRPGPGNVCPSRISPPSCTWKTRRRWDLRRNSWGSNCTAGSLTWSPAQGLVWPWCSLRRTRGTCGSWGQLRWRSAAGTAAVETQEEPTCFRSVSANGNSVIPSSNVHSEAYNKVLKSTPTHVHHIRRRDKPSTQTFTPKTKQLQSWIHRTIFVPVWVFRVGASILPLWSVRSYTDTWYLAFWAGLESPDWSGWSEKRSGCSKLVLLQNDGGQSAAETFQRYFCRWNRK